MSNYATHSISLWTDNDYGLYIAKCKMILSLDREVLPSDVENFVTEYMDGSTPDIQGKAQNVDWEELAQDWESDRKELMEYSQ